MYWPQNYLIVKSIFVHYDTVSGSYCNYLTFTGSLKALEEEGKTTSSGQFLTQNISRGISGLDDDGIVSLKLALDSLEETETEKVTGKNN